MAPPDTRILRDLERMRRIRVTENIPPSSTSTSSPAEILFRQHQDAEQSAAREGQSSNLARATALLAQPPSPFYRSMVEAADRIASGPVLDLAGSLVDENTTGGHARQFSGSSLVSNFSGSSVHTFDRINGTNAVSAERTGRWRDEEYANVVSRIETTRNSIGSSNGEQAISQRASISLNDARAQSESAQARMAREARNRARLAAASRTQSESVETPEEEEEARRARNWPRLEAATRSIATNDPRTVSVRHDYDGPGRATGGTSEDDVQHPEPVNTQRTPLTTLGESLEAHEARQARTRAQLAASVPRTQPESSEEREAREARNRARVAIANETPEEREAPWAQHRVRPAADDRLTITSDDVLGARVGESEVGTQHQQLGTTQRTPLTTLGESLEAREARRVRNRARLATVSRPVVGNPGAVGDRYRYNVPGGGIEDIGEDGVAHQVPVPAQGTPRHFSRDFWDTVETHSSREAREARNRANLATASRLVTSNPGDAHDQHRGPRTTQGTPGNTLTERDTTLMSSLEHYARSYRMTRRTLRDNTANTESVDPNLPNVSSPNDTVRGSGDIDAIPRERVAGSLDPLPPSWYDSLSTTRQIAVAEQGRVAGVDADNRREGNQSRSVPTAAALLAARHSWNLDANRSSTDPGLASNIGERSTLETLVALPSPETNSALPPRPDIMATTRARLSLLTAERNRRLNAQISNSSTQRSNVIDDPTDDQPMQSDSTTTSQNTAIHEPTQYQANRAKSKAMNHLRYLTKLKNAEENGIDALALARQLGIDSIHDSLVSERVCDLPMRIKELPLPEVSSWLEPAMGWSGQQTGGTRNRNAGQAFTSGILFAGGNDNRTTQRMLSLRARRHREQLRDQMNLLRGNGGEPRLSGLSRADEDQVFEDIERHLSEFVENSPGTIDGSESRPSAYVLPPRYRQGTSDNVEPTDPRAIPPSFLLRNNPTMVVQEKWPVKVALHSVDWDKKTITGTMTAINIPDQKRRNRNGQPIATEDDAKETSMESLFDGEIIDFRLHELETLKGKKGYNIGGAGVDVRYWSGVGPFKQAVERGKQIRLDKKRNYDENDLPDLIEAMNDYGLDSSKVIDRDSTPQQLNLHPTAYEGTEDPILTKDEEDEIRDEVMSKCLGSSKWMQENLKHWILMRWKERCFIPPPCNNTSSTSTSTETSFALTISGFYYVALHRQSGRIEGLYYDPASHPYQKLEMMPRDSRGSKSDADETGEEVRDGGGGGFRREFPIFELR